MGTRFENFAIGRAVAKLLNIKGMKNFPTELNTDQLQGILSIPGPHALFPQYLDADLVSTFINGIASYTYNCVGSNAAWANTAASNSIFTDISRGHWLRECFMELAYNNAGSIADDGRYVAFYGELFNPVSLRILPVFQYVVEIKSALTIYQLIWPQSSLPCKGTLANISTGGAWNGYIPPGYQFGVAVGYYVPGGGFTFPAATSIDGKILVQEDPEGFAYMGPN